MDTRYYNWRKRKRKHSINLIRSNQNCTCHFWPTGGANPNLITYYTTMIRYTFHKRFWILFRQHNGRVPYLKCKYVSGLHRCDLGPSGYCSILITYHVCNSRLEDIDSKVEERAWYASQLQGRLLCITQHILIERIWRKSRTYCPFYNSQPNTS